jgi:hypothetical protein
MDNLFDDSDDSEGTESKAGPDINVIVVEYFGEDENVCDTTNIFSVLREFKMAFEHSRKTIIARMERANRTNRSNSTGMGDDNKSPRY